MSPRPKRYRKIDQPPVSRGFQPVGGSCISGEPVCLMFDEFEAIKLADYESFSHEKAAHRMNVSRPTFTRIYEGARKKIAIALSENRSIIFEGGFVTFDKEWFRCNSCDSTFIIPDKRINVKDCPICNSNEIIHINKMISAASLVGKKETGCQYHEDTGYCICPQCGMKVSHQAGVPCRSIRCPDCKINMARDRS